MQQLPYSKLEKGTLLIASPDIDQGIYFRSVILLCEHAGAGSFGLIINKPLQVDLPDDVLNTKELANPNVAIRAGGPLQPNQMMLLHTAEQTGTLPICAGAYLGGDLQFLQESITSQNGPSMLLCFGYSGWGPGLLEREFMSSLWFPHPAAQTHLFEIPPEKLWQSLLREMGGKYSTLSMIPEDLTLN